MLQKISDRKNKSYLDVGDRRYTNTGAEGETNCVQKNQVVVIRKARFSRRLEQIVIGPHYRFPLKQTVPPHTCMHVANYIHGKFCKVNFLESELINS
jgi:hypothetical protein